MTGATEAPIALGAPSDKTRAVRTKVSDAEVSATELKAREPGHDSSTYMTESLKRWRRHTDGPLIALIVASLPLLVLELARSELPPGDELFLDIVNGFVFVAFLVDYVVELCLASDRRSYVRTEWLAAVLVVSQGLAVVPAFAALGVLRGARAVRAFRVLAVVARLFAIGGIAARDGRKMLNRYAGRISLGAAALTWLSAAVAFTLVEDVGEGQRLESLFDAMWWSTTTITTVGYGDIYPLTSIGRIVGGITMLVGISAFAVVTARVASFLVRDRPSPTTGSIADQLRELAVLRNEGLVTEVEFQAKRRDILGL
jgi:voltage-gated potassium channel